MKKTKKTTEITYQGDLLSTDQGGLNFYRSRIDQNQLFEQKLDKKKWIDGVEAIFIIFHDFLNDEMLMNSNVMLVIHT